MTFSDHGPLHAKIILTNIVFNFSGKVLNKVAKHGMRKSGFNPQRAIMSKVTNLPAIEKLDGADQVGSSSLVVPRSPALEDRTNKPERDSSAKIMNALEVVQSANKNEKHKDISTQSDKNILLPTIIRNETFVRSKKKSASHQDLTVGINGEPEFSEMIRNMSQSQASFLQTAAGHQVGI